MGFATKRTLRFWAPTVLFPIFNTDPLLPLPASSRLHSCRVSVQQHKVSGIFFYGEIDQDFGFWRGFTAERVVVSPVSLALRT